MNKYVNIFYTKVQGDFDGFNVASKSLQKLAVIISDHHLGEPNVFQIPILDPEQCSDKFPGFKPVPTQVCAGEMA